MSAVAFQKRRTTNPREAELAAKLIYTLSGKSELDEKIARFYPDGGRAAYETAIARFGNPPDQIENYERARIILQPKQLEFAAWARRLDTAQPPPGEMLSTPELGMGGARGPGKSFVVFAQTAVDDCQRFAGLKALYLRRTGKRALEQMEDMITSVLRRVPHKYAQAELRFPNGSFIVIGHFQTPKEAMNYLGLEYDVIIVEEATTLPWRAYQAMQQAARTSKAWRPRIYPTTNPLGIGHKWFKEYFVDYERQHAGDGDRLRKFIFATVDDNRAVNPEYRGQLDKLTGIERKAYRDGNWDVSAGAYFDQWDYDVHTVEPFVPPATWKLWASMDYGFNHWNVIYLHAQNGDGTIYTFAEMAHRKHYPREIVADLRAKLAALGIRLDQIEHFYAGADVFAQTGAAQKTVSEQYGEFGIKLIRADTSPGSRISGAHKIARLLGNAERGERPQWFVTRDCKRLIDTMPFLEANPNNPEDVVKVDADENGNGGDDPYDAVRYGLNSTGLKQLKTGTTRYA